MRSTITAVLAITVAAAVVVVLAEGVDLLAGPGSSAEAEGSMPWSVATALAGLVKVGVFGGIGWGVTSRLIRRSAGRAS